MKIGSLFEPFPTAFQFRRATFRAAEEELLSRQRDLSGSGQIQNGEGLEQFDQFLDLSFVAGDLDRQAFRLDINDFSPENVRDLHDLGTRLGVHLHPDKDQFAVFDVSPAEKIRVPSRTSPVC